MLPTPFSLIWVFQILIGYSKFLRNANLAISLMFQLFMILQHSIPNGSYFKFRFQRCLISLKIEDGRTKTDFNNCYFLAVLCKIRLFLPLLRLGSHFGVMQFFSILVLFSHSIIVMTKTSQLTGLATPN